MNWAGGLPGDRQSSQQVILGSVDGSDLLMELRHADGSWRPFKTIEAFDAYAPLRIDREGGRLWALGNIGRDKLALTRRLLALHAADPEFFLTADCTVREEGGVIHLSRRIGDRRVDLRFMRDGAPVAGKGPVVLDVEGIEAAEAVPG